MTCGLFVEIPPLSYRSLWIVPVDCPEPVAGCQQVTRRDPSSAGLARMALDGLCQLTNPCLSVCETHPCHRGHRGKCHPGSNQLAQEQSGDTMCDVPVGREQRWWPWHHSCAGSGL